MVIPEITVDIDERKVTRPFNRIVSLFGNVLPMLRYAARKIQWEHIGRRFQTGAGWKALAEATRTARERGYGYYARAGKEGPSRRILMWTHAARNSMISKGAAEGSIWRETETSVVFGSNLKAKRRTGTSSKSVLAMHHKGLGNNPRRLIYLRQQVVSSFKRTAVEWAAGLKKTLKGI